MQKRSRTVLAGLLAVMLAVSMGGFASALTGEGINGFQSNNPTRSSRSIDTTSIKPHEISKAETGDVTTLQKLPNLLEAGYVKAGVPIESAEYVESQVDELSRPVGAVGFTDKQLSSSSRISVIITFDSLPRQLQLVRNRMMRATTLSQSEYRAMTESFLSGLKREGISYSLKYTYEEIYFGAALTVPGNAIERIAAMDGVYSVTPDEIVSLSPGAVEYYSVDYASSADDANPKGMLESRQLFRSDDITASGITGKGVTVGVLDTGIDYNHPDLKGVYAGGHDYVDDDDDPMETTYKEWQGSGASEFDRNGNSYYTAHGTHVSGTIAGQGKGAYLSTIGLAPGIDKLIVMRVLGPYGTGDSSGIIKGVEDAANPTSKFHCDVINLSLGGGSNTPYDTLGTAYNNATIAGTVVVVSAGNGAVANNGTIRRANTITTPTTAYLPISTAASELGGGALQSFTQNVFSDSASNSSKADLLITGCDYANSFADGVINAPNLTLVPGKGYELAVVFGAGSPNPAPTELAQLTGLADGSLAGKILVVKRGIMNFTDMKAQALRLKAGALIIVNSDAQGEQFITGSTIDGEAVRGLPIFSSYNSAGRGILALSLNAPAYMLPGTYTTVHQAAVPASFSSVGPVGTTYAIKPDIMAPGSAILSCVPAFDANPDHNDTDYDYAYGRMNGTSMASPHIAGIAALARQKYPNATPYEIKARIMNTADPTRITPGFGHGASDTQASVWEQGAGFVDPYRLIVADQSTYITVPVSSIPGNSATNPITAPGMQLASLSFGTIGRAATVGNTLPIVIHNTGTAPLTYTLSSSVNRATMFSTHNDYGVKVAFDKTSVTVPAGSTATVNATLTKNADQGIAPERVEGYVRLSASTGNTYVLPYGAVINNAADIGSYAIFDVFLEKPVITANTAVTNLDQAGAHMIFSNTSNLWLSFAGTMPSTDLIMLILFDDKDTPYAYLESYANNLGTGGGETRYFVFGNFLTAKYLRCDPAGIPLANDYEDLPDGYYNVKLCIFHENGPADFFDSDMHFVKDDAPVVTTPENWWDVKIPSGSNMVEWSVRIKSHAIDVAMQHKLVFKFGGANIPVDYTSCLVTLYAGSGQPFFDELEGFYADPTGLVEFTTFTNPAYETGAVIDTGYKAFASDFEANPCYAVGGPFNGTVGIYTSNNKTAGHSLRYALSTDLTAVAAFHTATNGLLTATLSNTPPYGVGLADFTVGYQAAGTAKIVPLTVTGFSFDPLTTTASFEFDPFPQKAKDQTITFFVTYNGKTLSDKITIKGSGGPVTGDFSSTVFWASLLGAALIGTGVTFVMIRRRKKDNPTTPVE